MQNFGGSDSASASVSPTAERRTGEMLKGFSVPFTPQGKSALATLPPWHYSSDCMAIEYWANPGTIAALLPPGLTPDEKSEGRAFFWFLDWQFTGSNDELTDPARYQYREAFVLVEAIFEGMPINYCPYIFVDNDAAIARGWAQGFPKKLGSIYQTRTFSAPSLAAAPLAKGSRFGASVAAHGERLATARMQLEEKVDDPLKVFNRPTVMRRYFPQLAAGRWEKPPVDELTMSLTDDLAVVDVWAGAAELRLPEVAGEDMHMIAPLRVGRGYRLGMAYSVTELRILKSYAG
jgi:acetoacetate decarboxylase